MSNFAIIVVCTSLGSFLTMGRTASLRRGPMPEEKHGTKSRRNWRKLHLARDADSGDIIADVVTDQNAGDASQVEPLLDRIGVSIRQFTADGAYDGDPTYDAVTRHSPEAAVVIPPRANALNGRTAIAQLSETDTLLRSTPMAG